ncbi:hypothetical protein [Desertivirga brevis]|uniref:hypothetical protein n=1 Tax=Desertivirga brevis TaxID=2810310 RepID=UPI001A95DADC|nr:hypothetical protein [Pedobacter sp. SYSU D00873]
METERPPVSSEEFLIVSLTCFSAMDILAMEEGYDAITLNSVSERTGITKERLLHCFKYFEVLLGMYNTKLTLFQIAKMKDARIKLE